MGFDCKGTVREVRGKAKGGGKQAGLYRHVTVPNAVCVYVGFGCRVGCCGPPFFEAKLFSQQSWLPDCVSVTVL